MPWRWQPPAPPIWLQNDPSLYKERWEPHRKAKDEQGDRHKWSLVPGFVSAAAAAVACDCRESNGFLDSGMKNTTRTHSGGTYIPTPCEPLKNDQWTRTIRGFVKSISTSRTEKIPLKHSAKFCQILRLDAAPTMANCFAMSSTVQPQR